MTRLADDAAAIAFPDDAIAAACLLAVAPNALRGLRLRARNSPQRDAYLALLKSVLTASGWHRLPPSTSLDHVQGGLDLAVTLAQGRPVVARGLIARAAGGVVVVPMAERLSPALAGCLSDALDAGDPIIVIAIDEGIDDERMPDGLADRLALHVDLDMASGSDAGSQPDAARTTVEIEGLHRDIAAARNMMANAPAAADVTAETIAALSLSLDVRSLRAVSAALMAARVAAALDDCDTPDEAHIACALRLVLLPRARHIPQSTEAPAPPPPPETPAETPTETPNAPQQLDDVILAAALARLPPDLLARLASDARSRADATSGARGGKQEARARHGRPAGTRTGDPTRGDRLDLVATLRTAAPWQSLRKRAPGGPVVLQRSDFRVKRLVRPTGVTTIFLVDASGSSALHRLAEVKGAVELLLAECYVRRDHVALIAFRGKKAELLLPPTRALARAKSALAALPGGGGTPLASALMQAETVSADVRRRGNRADIVVLTDGRANIDRNGRPGRAAAEADAHLAAKSLRARGVGSLVIDTSARPDPASNKLASALGATYLALPYADARTLSSAIKTAGAAR